MGLNAIANWCLHRVGVEPVDEVAAGRDPETLRELVDQSAEAGALDRERRDQLLAAVEAATAALRTCCVVDNGREGIREGGATGGNNRYRNNLLWNNDRDRILLRLGNEADTIVTDPQFIDYRPDGSGDYRLQPSSPAVNGGFTDSSPSVAIDGTPRPQGRTVDCGVYEQ